MEIKNLWSISPQKTRRLKSIFGWFILIVIMGIQCFGNIAWADYPADPPSNLEWPSNNDNTVSSIQARFNSARTNENDLLNLSIPMMSLPSQNEWDAMSDSEKALWLINRERIDRGVDPLHGIESNVVTVAQNYAQYLLDNNLFTHYADGNPWQRLESNPAIGSCHDFLNVAENLAIFMSSGSGWTLPIERAVYSWMYDDLDPDNSLFWGHRHAILWYPYNDNSGPSGMEGFLGIGRASGTFTTVKDGLSTVWPGSDIIVMNVFDPCVDWQYETETNCDEIGVKRDSKWFLDNNGSGYWDDGDVLTGFGLASDVPVVGDWNGDGIDEIGVKRGSKWFLDYNGNGYWDGGDVLTGFGLASDVPVVGDWNGDGIDDIGVKRGSKWFLDYNGNGYWDGGDDLTGFGLAFDVPVVGDWNGDGIDDIGVKRGSKWFLDYNGNGYWDGGDDLTGFGLASDVPVVGDWNGDGIDAIGVKRGSKWFLDYNGNGYWDGGDVLTGFGLASDVPVAGKWAP